MRRLGLVFAALCLSGTLANATSYTLADVDTFGRTISGSITTDSAIGAVLASDVQDWSVTVDGDFVLLPSNSIVVIVGDHLMATSDSLFFNYNPDGPGDDQFIFEITTGNWGQGGTLAAEFAYTVYGFFAGELNCPGDPNIIHCGIGTDPVFRTGDQSITPTPLPGAFWLFAGGLATLGATGRRRLRPLPLR